MPTWYVHVLVFYEWGCPGWGGTIALVRTCARILSMGIATATVSGSEGASTHTYVRYLIHSILKKGISEPCDSIIVTFDANKLLKLWLHKKNTFWIHHQYIFHAEPVASGTPTAKRETAIDQHKFVPTNCSYVCN